MLSGIIILTEKEWVTYFHFSLPWAATEDLLSVQQYE